MAEPLRYSFAGARKGAKLYIEAPWRSWLARRPVTAEVAGSSPVGVAYAVMIMTPIKAR
jgi:hypothetical protein